MFCFLYEIVHVGPLIQEEVVYIEGVPLADTSCIPFHGTCSFQKGVDLRLFKVRAVREFGLLLYMCMSLCTVLDGLQLISPQPLPLAPPTHSFVPFKGSMRPLCAQIQIQVLRITALSSC